MLRGLTYKVWGFEVFRGELYLTVPKIMIIGRVVFLPDCDERSAVWPGMYLFSSPTTGYRDNFAE